MSDFQGWIKNIERIRTYIREYFPGNLIVDHQDFNKGISKIPASYERERTWITSLLQSCFSFSTSKDNPSFLITKDKKQLSQSPLFTLWKSHFFTDQDLTLHCYLLSLLKEYPHGITAHQAAEELSFRYGLPFDDQSVRGSVK